MGAVGMGSGGVALCLSLFAVLAAGPAHAVDAVTSASPAEQRAGVQNAAVWIVGRGFVPGTTVTISGDGIQPLPRAPEVVPQADRIDGGLGDGLTFYFSVDANATNGPRDVTVTAPDGRSVTAFQLITIVEGAEDGPPVDDPPVDDPPVDDPPVDDPPPAQAGRADVIARASPRYGAQGDQVNLWIVGRSFDANSEVRFSVDGLGPASFQGAPLPAQVYRAVERINGEVYDGIQYFLRIPADARPGFVDISVQNADGSSATGAKVFEIVEPGELPQPVPGMGNIDEITGASPPALLAGRNAAVWVWGRGFAAGAQITFSKDGIQQVAPAEVVETAANYPGYAGLRAFVQIAGDTPPGLVDLSIRNPNGTVATGSGLLQILPPGGNGGAVGGGGAVNGPCPDMSRLIGAIDEVVPLQARRGDVVPFAILGQDFACGASVVIKGGGLTPVEAPQLVSDTVNPSATTMYWRLLVQPEAALGPRDVTIVNPNGSTRTLPGAFEILEGKPQDDGVHACSARPGTPAPAPLWLGLLLLLGLRPRRR
ncbi:MAG: hypothetical protein KC613_20670 [Myxococcales bacterium]|nr:hypothetical protein [Myxococcales bacterium]MCB9523312.1 hypothetical protein [Myxococcales bacterium]